MKLPKHEDGGKTDLILLDLSKAFGEVAHKKLISKLHFCGIRGKILSWLKTFWIVVLNRVKSDSSTFRCPAGLSPWAHALPSIHK